MHGDLDDAPGERRDVPPRRAGAQRTAAGGPADADRHVHHPRHDHERGQPRSAARRHTAASTVAGAIGSLLQGRVLTPALTGTYPLSGWLAYRLKLVSGLRVS